MRAIAKDMQCRHYDCANCRLAKIDASCWPLYHVPGAGGPASPANRCSARSSIHLLLAPEPSRVEWAPVATVQDALASPVVLEVVESEGAAMEVVEALLPPVQSVALPLPPHVSVVRSNPALMF